MEIAQTINKNKIDLPKSAARVFIVEDEPTSIILTEAMLKQIGYKTVGVATSYETAMAALKVTAVDIVLVDLVLSGTKTGLDVIRELNRLNIPCILITGTTSDATLLKLADLDVYGFLPKPFDQAALATALQLALKKFTRMQDKIFEEADAIKSRILATKVLEEEFGTTEHFFLSKKRKPTSRASSVTGVNYRRRILGLTLTGIVVTLAALFGYLLDVHWSGMKLSAMLCLLLVGAGLLAENQVQVSSTVKIFSFIAMSMSFLISGATLLQYMMSYSTPGRMAVTTALSIFVLSAALISNRIKSFRYHINFTEGFALVSLTLSFLGILGYLFGQDKFNQIIPYSLQPRPTFLILVFFAISVFYLNPTKGLMSILSNRRVSAKLGRKMLVGINGLMIVLSIAVYKLLPKSSYYGLEVLFLLIASVAVLSLVIVWATLKLIKNEIQFEKSVSLIENRERELQFVLKRVPNPVAVLDRELRYILTSRKWIDDFNLKDKNIIGRSHYEVFPHLSEEIKQLNQRALNGEIINTAVQNIADPEGRRIHVKGEIRPWFDINNQVAGIIIFIESITYPAVQAAPALDQ